MIPDSDDERPKDTCHTEEDYRTNLRFTGEANSCDNIVRTEHHRNRIECPAAAPALQVLCTDTKVLPTSSRFG